jgi:hypothetical protein
MRRKTDDMTARTDDQTPAQTPAPSANIPAGYVLASDGLWYGPNQHPPGTVEPEKCAACGGVSGSMVRDKDHGVMVHRENCATGRSLEDAMRPDWVGPPRSGVLAPPPHQIRPIHSESFKTPDGRYVG